MYISKILISNYKSYLSSSVLELKPGFNIVTGRNNAGKSALLEALKLNIANRPHLSAITAPMPDSVIATHSRVEFSIMVNTSELRTILSIPNSAFNIPLPHPQSAFAIEHGFTRISSDSPGQLLDWLFSNEEIIFNMANGSNTNWIETSTPTYNSYTCLNQGNGMLQFFNYNVSPEGQIIPPQSVGITSANPNSEFGYAVVTKICERIYLFKAERMNVGDCPLGHNNVLAPNAANLPEVLANLQSDPGSFKRFNDAVTRVLPQINQVTVENRQGNRVEIVVWLEDRESRWLTVPLSECGTGIGQVLAILYVVMSSTSSRTILIDEPQSFLHPGAVRKLMELLRQYPQHQYVITTHSPTVITACRPDTITWIKQNGSVSDFEFIDPSEHAQLRYYLEDIGASLSDVFGVDNILWVEGPTEEACFPQILEKLTEVPLMGTGIIGVKHTGDFEGKHKKTVIDIYKRLSKGKGLLPPAIGFIFDPEDRTQTDLESMVRESGGSVSFLQRRLYENYLLNPKAITQVLNETPGFNESEKYPVSVEAVSKWIEDHKRDAKFAASTASDEDWIIKVHGAKLLNELFDGLSDYCVQYEKTTHSVALTEWLIENSPGDLEDIKNLLIDKLKANRQANT